MNKYYTCVNFIAAPGGDGDEFLPLVPAAVNVASVYR